MILSSSHTRHTFRLFTWILTCLAVTLCGLTATTQATSSAANRVAPLPAVAPTAMAALGDSITRAFNGCGWYQDCESRSWATGNEQASSHYQLLSHLNHELVAFNNARTGAVSAELVSQAEAAVAQNADYVTILIGANDACTPTPDAMTPVEVYRTHINAALGVLQKGLPDAHIFIASVPNIHHLWAVGKDTWGARSVWNFLNICQSMLANPTSDDVTDVARRDYVSQRVIDYNAQLAEACSAHGPSCRYDEGAVYSYPFTKEHLSSWDYFHPNQQGQQILADVTFHAGFRWQKT